MNKINVQHHRTGIGELILGSSGGRLCLLGFGHEEMGGAVGGRIKKSLSAVLVERDDEILARTRQQIDEYLNGRRREFDIPLLLLGTDFQKRVWESLMKVPYGSTSTYRRIAEEMDSPKAVRAVGNACKANPIAIIVPCHRIIGSNGTLVGYGGGISLKEELLKLEQSNTARCGGRVDTVENSDRSVSAYRVRRVP
jgi:methylated-DNA-[protein]-cysteine S-methyltransferase